MAYQQDEKPPTYNPGGGGAYPPQQYPPPGMQPGYQQPGYAPPPQMGYAPPAPTPQNNVVVVQQQQQQQQQQQSVRHVVTKNSCNLLANYASLICMAKFSCFLSNYYNNIIMYSIIIDSRDAEKGYQSCATSYHLPVLPVVDFHLDMYMHCRRL